jgi:hypothetical protein
VAGPAGSFLLLFVARWLPLVAICGFIQGSYNLLPLGTMDGGRVVACLLRVWCSEKAELLIMPRVEIAQDGTWTRAIDMHTVEPEYRGIRVTTRTDVQEARIQYDSSQVYTRLIGLGKEDLTFKDVVWKVSSGDPVNKPAGQNYVELPAAEIAAITRSGRPRTGAYFVDDVSDANVLIKKTWDRLQKLKEPQITLDARIADLYKMGYGGQSMRLYDSVQVILEAIDTRIMARIIDLERDWLRPENTRPMIGTSLGADILDDIRISSNLR